MDLKQRTIVVYARCKGRSKNQYAVFSLQKDSQIPNKRMCLLLWINASFAHFK